MHFHPFRALRHHNFRLYWAGQFVSLTGSSMQLLAMAWLVVQLVDPAGHALLRHGAASASAIPAPSHYVEARTNWYSGLISFLGGLPVFVLTLYAGALADRLDKRSVLIVTQTGFVLCSLALGALCVTGIIALWQVMIFALLVGTLSAFDSPSQEAITAELVGEEDLPSAIALGSVIYNVARSIGPAIAGLLLASRISIGTSFLANGACTLCSVAALIALRLPRSAAKKAQADLKAVVDNIIEGFLYVRANPAIRNLCFLVASFGMFAFAFNVLVPVFIRFALMTHASNAAQARAFGTMEMGCGVGAVFGAIVVTALGNPRTQRIMLVVSGTCAPILLLLFALSHSVWMADLLISSASGVFMVCFATCNTLVQQTAPDAIRGRVISIYMMMVLGTEPLGSLLAGWVARLAGPMETMVLFGSVCVAAALLLMFRKNGLMQMAISEVN